jgi:hypothetical protein
MSNVLELFSTDRRLLETRGSLIIRQLCLHLNAERIFRSIAEILEKDDVSWVAWRRGLHGRAHTAGPGICEHDGGQAQHDSHHVARARRLSTALEESRLEGEQS